MSLRTMNDVRMSPLNWRILVWMLFVYGHLLAVWTDLHFEQTDLSLLKPQLLCIA